LDPVVGYPVVGVASADFKFSKEVEDTGEAVGEEEGVNHHLCEIEN
jgi:hypothetical protein